MYFLRLAMLKPSVEEIAADAWEGAEVPVSQVLLYSFVEAKCSR